MQYLDRLYRLWLCSRLNKREMNEPPRRSHPHIPKADPNLLQYPARCGAVWQLVLHSRLQIIHPDERI